MIPFCFLIYFLDVKIIIIKTGINRHINTVNHNGTIVLSSFEFNLFTLQFKRLFIIKKKIFFIKNKNSYFIS